MIERYDVPYQKTEIDKKTESIKKRYTDCLLRYLS